MGNACIYEEQPGSRWVFHAPRPFCFSPLYCVGDGSLWKLRSSQNWDFMYVCKTHARRHLRLHTDTQTETQTDWHTHTHTHTQARTHAGTHTHTTHTHTHTLHTHTQVWPIHTSAHAHYHTWTCAWPSMSGLLLEKKIKVSKKKNTYLLLTTTKQKMKG